MNSKIAALVTHMEQGTGAQGDLVADLQNELWFEPPSDYIAFLKQINGVEGIVGEQGGYLVLWPVQELLTANAGYDVQDAAPELFLIGTDGGGEGFAFDTSKEDLRIVEVPLITLDADDAWFCGNTLEDLLEYVSRKTD